MTDDEKKKNGVFGRGPFSEPFSPFGKKRTPEEIKERKLKKAAEQAKLEGIMKRQKYDKITLMIANTINSILGFWFAQFYLIRYRLFNFMIVGGTGTVVSWLLYEGLFRPVFTSFLSGGLGTFIGMAVTTICVFFWNYTWNEAWTFKYKNIEKVEMNEGERDYSP